MNHEPKISNDAAFKCIFCGSKIIVPIDEATGAKQELVDECPKCSRSNVIHIRIDGGSSAGVGEGTFA